MHSLILDYTTRRSEVVKQNYKNILKEIETHISEMLTNGNTVPSNTEDSWYKDLSELKPQDFSINFLRSKMINR